MPEKRDWLSLDDPEVAEWHERNYLKPLGWRAAWCSLRRHKPYWRKVRQLVPYEYEHGPRAWHDLEYRCLRCDCRQPLRAMAPSPPAVTIICWLAVIWLVDLLTMVPVGLLMSCNWHDEPRTLLGLGWQWAIRNSDCWLCCPYRPAWW